MAASTPAFFWQQQLDGQFSVYSADGSLVLSDIETLGDARNHILDLIAASDDLSDALDAIIAEAQSDRAALDDHEAQAVAMAYGPALTVEAA